ncbi:hypothetical protein Pmani_002712 [Petrolisthes manimaculis]|uniref:GRIP domain-containing protein n=1 Tax=Petrolisthes manimaculis TaxID=1843537 RepID=A0AAE1QI59_9EUCA|nr:hypothetical protein Pmani_002712 [Petrolisthes manimaculis]
MASKRDLLTTVERQKEQLTKYELKLKDVVRAYKGLLKEKEALEASLSALAVSEGAKGEEKREVCRSDTEDESHPSQPLENKESEEAESSSSCGEEDLQKKVAALTAALTTLSSEKKRIETSFQNDRKQLLAEKEKLEKSLREEQDSLTEYQSSSESKIQDLRSRLIVAQHERDVDSQNAAVMIREVESKLAVERSGRERAETGLEQARQQLGRTPAMPTQQHHSQYEKKITQLQNELEQVRSRLKRAEQQAEEPPLLKKLQEQMEEMRIQHMEALQQERTRAGVVEEGARGLANTQEERVAALETKLGELSHTVASYHRSKQDHLHTIHTLKEKLSELAEEKTSLMSRLEEPECEKEADVSTLYRRLLAIKDQLINTNMASEHPLDVESILFGGENIHAKCEQEYDQLKEEFETYKISSKQQAKIVGETFCKGDCNKVVEELRHKVRSLTSAAQLAADSHSQQITSLRQELTSLRETHENQLRRVESENRATIAALEEQLSLQQQRSLSTLSERDQEIQRLTEQLHQRHKSPQQSGGVGSLEATAALLSQVSGGSEGPLLHHLEELARRDQEVAQLRRDKRQLETTMREVQMAAIVRQQAQQDTIEALQEEAERHRRNVSREGENLEYLKNVVLKYMMSSDAECRQLMLNAISAVLKFTSKEVESVRKYNALWWWQPAPRQIGPGKTNN